MSGWNKSLIRAFNFVFSLVLLIKPWIQTYSKSYSWMDGPWLGTLYPRRASTIDFKLFSYFMFELVKNCEITLPIFHYIL